MKEIGAIVFFVIIIAVLIGIGPLLTIWSINALFGLGIAYTFKTWLAALFLGACLYQRNNTSK